MKKRIQKMMKNEKGLTLVELLAVIVILGIIAAIAVPSIGNIIANSKVNALKADGQNVLNAANLYFVENSDEPSVTQAKLITAGFLQDAGGFSATGAVAAVVTKATGATTATEVNTIKGTAANGGLKVEFDAATSASINEHKKENTTTVKVSKE